MVNRVKDFRSRRGITQKELALLAKIYHSHLKKIERGEGTPSLKVAVRIAKVLDCSLDDLFF